MAWHKTSASEWPSYGKSGNAFPAAQRAKLFISSGLDAHTDRRDPQSGAQSSLHLLQIRGNTGRFCNKGRVHIHDAAAALPNQRNGFRHNIQGRDVLAGRIARRKPVADVRQPGSAQQGIRNGVA